MRIIAETRDRDTQSFLVSNGGPLADRTVVQLVVPGVLVGAPISVASHVTHDQFTAWYPATDPPPLATILDGVDEWPVDANYTMGPPFLTKEVGERIVADAATV